MPTILHLTAGLALGRLHAGRASMRHSLVFGALACLPDADLLLHFAGVPYGAALGHRGAAHSLAAAVLVGVLAAVLVRRAEPVRTGVFVTLAVASHGLLDMLTHGGHGVGLFWPLDATRHTFPWQPIPAAPMGMAFFGPRGAAVLQAEGPASLILLALACCPSLRWGTAQGLTTSEGPETLSSS